jgi:hypothetical protein
MYVYISACSTIPRDKAEIGRIYDTTGLFTAKYSWLLIWRMTNNEDVTSEAKQIYNKGRNRRS